MTLNKLKKTKEKALSSLGFILSVFLLLIALIYSPYLKEGVLNGFKRAFLLVVPTLFPFFIISDLLLSNPEVKKNGIISKFFERLFGINGLGISAFLLGNTCGFPVGVKVASQLFKSGAISKNELINLCSISNNPSLAFVISGIGIGLYSDVKKGIVLYLSVLFSSVIIGLINNTKGITSSEKAHITRQSFNFINSVKAATDSSITIASLIALFSAIGSIIKTIPAPPFIYVIFLSFTEVCTACISIVEGKTFLGSLSLPLTAFSMAFSGACVHMQAFSFLPKDFPKGQYVFNKVLQGIIAALITLVYCIIQPK